MRIILSLPLHKKICAINFYECVITGTRKRCTFDRRTVRSIATPRLMPEENHDVAPNRARSMNLGGISRPSSKITKGAGRS